MATRRRFGRVRQLPSKRWQARYADADGVLHSAPNTFARKSDAERWLVVVENDMQRGVFIDPHAGQITVGEWAQRWLASAVGHLKRKTHAGYASLLKTKIVPRFGTVPLSSMKPILVGEWVADLHRAGLSPSRVRQSYRLLSQIMDAAVENDLIAVSPCRGVRLPSMPQTEPHILSEQEADLIIAAITAPHDVLVALLAYGGLRIGEVFALRRRSIDLAAGAVIISESLVEIAGLITFDTPKNHQKRTVTVPKFVLDMLTRRMLEIDEGPDALLFPSTVGKPQHYNAWRTAYFDPAVRAAGLTDITPHDLRASHATWVTSRHGVMAAAARLGHANASVTTRHYARTVQGQDRAVAEDLGQARAVRGETGAKPGRRGTTSTTP